MPTYEQILQRTPQSSEAGNTAAAAGFVVFLSSIVEGDRETFAQLSVSQQRYVYRLREKWQRRAAGKDTRWNEYGSRPGRPVVERRKTHVSRRDPGEHDPLFQSLMRKYGGPRDAVDD